MKLDSKTPSGPLEKKWEKHIMDGKLVNPANKRKYEVIIVGTGLAGASAAAGISRRRWRRRREVSSLSHSWRFWGGADAGARHADDEVTHADVNDVGTLAVDKHRLQYRIAA